MPAQIRLDRPIIIIGHWNGSRAGYGHVLEIRETSLASDISTQFSPPAFDIKLSPNAAVVFLLASPSSGDFPPSLSRNERCEMDVLWYMKIYGVILLGPGQVVCEGVSLGHHQDVRREVRRRRN